MPRELSAAVEAIVNAQRFTYYDYAQIQLPLGPGEIVPLRLVISTAEIEVTPAFDFTAFTYTAFAAAFNRSPRATEEADWLDALRTGFDVDTVTLVTAAKSLVDGLFADAEYTDRMRTDDQFIEDLFRAFLARPSDAIGKTLWLGFLAGHTRDETREAFGMSSEFNEWAGGLNQPATAENVSRDLGDLSFAEGLGTDGMDFALTNAENTYSDLFGQAGRRLYPARAATGRAFKRANGSFETVEMTSAFAKFNVIDADTVKISIISDMNRRGVDVVEQVTQRCSHSYKDEGCASPDPSDTCSRIKNDAVNGCASKLPALVNIDAAPTDNRARFKGISQPSASTTANPSVGLDPIHVDNGGWPGDIDITDPRLRKIDRLYYGIM